MAGTKTRTTALLGAAYVSPFAIMTCYLFYSRLGVQRYSAATDYIAMAVGILAFLFGCFAAPIPRKRRIVMALVSVTVIVVGLFINALWFVCSILHDCL